jgi:chromate reductase
VTILIINAGRAGATGNSQVLAEHCAGLLTVRHHAHRVFVLQGAPLSELRAALEAASGIVLVTGSYWGGCSSELQRALEELTPSECTELWLGKPAAVFVTAHQVGAQSVLWRLQGVLVSLGCVLPPLSGVVITRLAEELRRRAPELCRDVWGLDDLPVALNNVLAYLPRPATLQTWPVDREAFAERWLSES